jgi:predicted phosphodiesterase
MRLAVVGDVHGHAEELAEMLRKIEAHQVDQIVLLGDLVDRGPDPLLCLDIAQKWAFKARCGRERSLDVLSGNHEDNYARAWMGLPKPGTTNVKCYPSDLALYRALTRTDLHWMSTLPHAIKVEQLDLLLVHGGILPEMEELSEVDERVMRVRYLDDRGAAVPGFLPTKRFWADEYDGRFGNVVFGHESFSAPKVFKHAIGLDGEGRGRLHAAIFTDERSGLTFKTFTVDYKKRAFLTTGTDADKKLAAQLALW